MIMQDHYEQRSDPLAPRHAQTPPPAAPAATTLQTITVTGKTNQGDMRPGALRDDIVKTESISAKATERAGATNVNEALNKSPGIAVQMECSICNVRNVLLIAARRTTAARP